MQEFKDKEGRLVQVMGRDLTDPVQFSSQGGGFVHKMPLSSFKEQFEPFRGVQPFKSVKVTIDGCAEDFVFSAYANGRHWNGWVMPYFTREEGLRYAQQSPDLSYNEADNTFVIKYHDAAQDDEPEIVHADNVQVDGIELEVFPIGAGSWCWELAD